KEEFLIELKTLMDVYKISFDSVEGVILSSVVPELTDVIGEGMAFLTGHKPMVVGRGIRTGIRIATDQPASVGADLVADAVAGAQEHEGPLLIFDLGTATTCLVVDGNRTYLGHIIMPGIRISQDALTERTSQLPHVRFEKPRHVIGKNTIESMQSGIIYGSAAMIDGLIDRLEQELGQKTTVLVTGGIAGIIVPHCRHEIIYDPNLLLKGLWYIYNKKESES
ncbi:MAG: type III pantothenate kinase, partial [Lachnospiraceae bacterium]|nr:type III pantothenate kinase [Lachnospiraceae bacterium]